MITATEYFLSKATSSVLNAVKDFFRFEGISSEEVDRVRLSKETQYVIDGHFKQLEATLSLFKDEVLKENGYTSLLDLKKEIKLLAKVKEYEKDLVYRKTKVLESIDSRVYKELHHIVNEAKIIKETSRYVSFICKNEKVKNFIAKEDKENFLFVDGLKFKIASISNTENKTIFLLDRNEYLEKTNKDKEDLIDAKKVRALKEHYNQSGINFAPTKLGLAPIFEHDVLEKDMEFKQFYYDYIKKGQVERLRYYDVLDLMKNNFVPNCIVLKQTIPARGGLRYTNGWFHSRLVNGKNLKLKIEDDAKYDDPEYVKADLEKWRKVYKEGKKR